MGFTDYPVEKKAMKRIREDWDQTCCNKVLGKPVAEKVIKKLKTHPWFCHHI